MKTDGILAHRLDGQGEDLLLLNGGFMTIASWDRIAAPLARRHRVLRCDLRGQLHSPGPAPADLEKHVEDVTALLDALGVERVHAIGASFGAEVGLLLAALRPARVASLVAATAADVATPLLRSDGPGLRRRLEAGAGGEERGEVFHLMQEILYSPAFVAGHRDELRDAAAQAARLPDAWFSGAAGLLASLENLDLRRYLGAIACPVLVLAAGEDRVMPLERSRALASAIPSARLEVVEGSGHALVVEQPERFVRSCLEFLASVHGYD